MTSREEWLQAFDLEYNNVMANLAAPLDDFEISVFLTKAQELIVQQLYADKFEGTEASRRVLDALVTTSNGTKLDAQSPKFGGVEFSIPEAVMYITYETVTGEPKISSCVDKTGMKIRPVLQDELHKTIRNPFKGPSTTTVLRVDSGEDKVELIYSKDDFSSIKDYQVTYIKKPHPIILFTNTTDTIDGTYVTNTGTTQAPVYTAHLGTETWNIDSVQCELDSLIHKSIVTQAVALAAAAYKL